MKKVLLIITFLPILALLILYYQQDKFQKNPIPSLAKAFLGGILVFILNLALVGLINQIWVSTSVFYSTFWQAGFPEELSFFIVFMALLWTDNGFRKYKDGIVFATFMALTFAAFKNIMYIYDWGGNSFLGGDLSSGFPRAVLSIPAHFLFGVMTGFLFSLAKFSKKSKKILYLITGLVLAFVFHSLFEWILLTIPAIDKAIICVIYVLFITADILLWIYGRRYFLEKIRELKAKRSSSAH